MSFSKALFIFCTDYLGYHFFVGIGTIPLYPLHVNGSANTGNVGSYAGYYANYVWQNQTAIDSASIYTSHFIVAGQGFAVSGNILKLGHCDPPFIKRVS